MAKTVGELLTQSLGDIGATQVFGIVGDALNEFTDAIRRDDRMTLVRRAPRGRCRAGRRRPGQGHGPARRLRRHHGPGATHLLAGLYEARHDHAPVLAIAGDVPTNLAGIDYLQAADHVQAFRDACVYSASIVSADAAPAQIHEAIATAYGKRGVALLNIPQDVFAAKTVEARPQRGDAAAAPELIPAAADIEAAAGLIDQAATVTLFAGHGAAGAGAEVLALSDRLQAPVVHTYRALDQFEFADPRVVGGLGLIGSKAGLRERASMRRAAHDRQRLSLQRVPARQGDGDPDRRARRRRSAGACRSPKPCVGSSKPALTALLERVRPKTDSLSFAPCRRNGPTWQAMLDEKADPARSPDRIHPQALARAVSDLAADDAVFCVDTGEVTLWTANWLRPRAGRS